MTRSNEKIATKQVITRNDIFQIINHNTAVMHAYSNKQFQVGI